MPTSNVTNPLDTAPCGAISGLYGDVLLGWAMDPHSPDLRLAVEIYVDHAFVALTRADREQPLHAPGDGFHGFVVQLNPAWLQQARHVAARIANQGPWLDGTLLLPSDAPAARDSLPTSQVWLNGLKLKGWAWDSATPEQPVGIRVHEAGRLLVEGEADRPHQLLISRQAAEHGFDLDLPWTLADGRPHELHIETAQGVPLNGSPVHLQVHPAGLNHLLERHWPGARDEAAFALLDSLSRFQDRRAPQSIGFCHYPEWYALYQQAPEQRATPGKVLVVLLGEGDAQMEQLSLASLQAQRLPGSQVAVIAPGPGELPAQLHPHLATLHMLVPLQRGDRLAPHALDSLLAALEHADTDWVYADCDQDDDQGGCHNPWLKPAWDETLFYGVDLITPGAALSGQAVRRAIAHLQQCGPSSEPNWHLLLSSVVAVASEHVRHLPQVLYHRYAKAPDSPLRSLPDASRGTALQWLAAQRVAGARIDMVAAHPALYRVRWPLPQTLPTISLIVPTRDQPELLRSCIEGLLENTDYPALEIIVVDNDSREPATQQYLASLAARGVRILHYPHPFNYAAINNWAIEQARGSIVGLINNDVEVIESGWLKEMLAQLLRPGVGAVGAKLLWANGMVQHGGVVVGIDDLVAHSGNTWDHDDPGYLGFNQLAREQSAVTAACLLVRKSDYLRLGGLDQQHFPVTLNDVDFCLRLRSRGLRVVWSPFAQLIHAESASRGKTDSQTKAARAAREQMHFRQRWADFTRFGDPYYHPGLSQDYLTGPYGGLAIPPRPLVLR